MRKLFLAILFLPLILSSCAQTRCGTKKVYAYYTSTLPGTQMVDDNGNPVPPKPNITRFIYVESDERKVPEIDSVLYDNISLPASINRVEGNSTVVGNRFQDNEELTITAKKGYALWKIDLMSSPSGKPVPVDCKNILLRIKIDGKTCVFKINEESQLFTLPMY